MQVFELYIRRLLKRKTLIVLMLVLPILASYVLVQAVEPSHAHEYAHMLNIMIGLLVIITLMNTMLFYSDRQYATDKRILLSTYSLSSFNRQIVAVFLVVSAIQLMIVMLFTSIATDVYFPLTILDRILILFAYILLNTIAVGLGLMVTNYSRSKQSSWLRLIVIGLVFVLLGGLMLPIEHLPAFIREVVIILPTYWLTKIVIFILDDISKHIYPLAGYLLSLSISAAVIMMLLARTKSERI